MRGSGEHATHVVAASRPSLLHQRDTRACTHFIQLLPCGHRKSRTAGHFAIGLTRWRATERGPWTWSTVANGHVNPVFQADLVAQRHCLCANGQGALA